MKTLTEQKQGYMLLSRLNYTTREAFYGEYAPFRERAYSKSASLRQIQCTGPFEVTKTRPEKRFDILQAHHTQK